MLFRSEDEADPKGDLAASYRLLATLEPLIVAHQTDGTVHGFVLNQGSPSVDFVMQGYTVHVSLDEIFGNHAENGFGLIMATGKDELIGAGKGFRVSFTPLAASGPKVGIAAVDEGVFENGKWIPGRRLNGDENDQGKGWRFTPRQLTTEKVTLYHFE